MKNPVDQAHFISLVASRTGIAEDALFAALKKANPVSLPEREIDDTILPHNIAPNTGSSPHIFNPQRG